MPPETSKNGLTLILSKCNILKHNLEFFGFCFTKEGTKPDPKKVQASVNSPRPTNVSELRSLLGMSNYSSQYIHDYVTITQPLHRLTHKDEKFIWGKEQEAYQKLKNALLSSPVMSYYITMDNTPGCFADVVVKL